MPTAIPDRTRMESLWLRDGAWFRSPFIREFLKRARAQYPTPQTKEKSAWPDDEEGIAQNFAYLFTGHVLKINKVLCGLLGDAESFDYLSQTRSITVLDMACGAGMASVGLIDFLHGIIKAGVIQRQSPLSISFILNDLNRACVTAAGKSLMLARRILNTAKANVIIDEVQTYTGSVSGVASFIRNTPTNSFDVSFFCNAFDHVLMYGHKALEKDPQCSDPIAHASPCDRPPLLAKLFQQLGACANPYFSRVLFLQESRHYPLISVALPSPDLFVNRTWMTQEADRPDVTTPTINVRFGYCACRYGYSNDRFSPQPSLQPLNSQENRMDTFSEAFGSRWFDEADTDTKQD